MPDPYTQAGDPNCPLCERPHIIINGSFGDFCSEFCKNFYEKATGICHLCGNAVEVKYEDAHKRGPCIEARMDRIREEIRGKEREIDRLAQELRAVGEHG